MASKPKSEIRYSAEAVRTRLRHELDSSGMTQSEFAKRIGISQPLLNQILSADRAPNEEVLNLLKMRMVVEKYYVEVKG